MKRIFLASAALVFIGTTAVKAQSTTFGIKASVQNNLLVVKTKTGGDFSRQAITGIGFNVGGVADIKFSENFSLQPQLLFSSKTTKASSASTIDLLTLDLPINFLYKTNGYFIGLGPNLSYGLSAKIKTDGSPDQDLYEDGATTAFNHLEFGANATMGYQFPSGLVLAANYTPGLSDLNSNNGATTSRFNTRTFGFSIGYMFSSAKPMKKK